VTASRASRRPGRRLPAGSLRTASALLFLLFAAALGCAREENLRLREFDAAAEELHAAMGTAIEAIGQGDAAAVRAARERLVALRLGVEDLSPPRRSRELRETLLRALDDLVDALDATAAGMDGRDQAEQEEDTGAGQEELRSAAGHLERGQARLESALALLKRYGELRRRLDPGD